MSSDIFTFFVRKRGKEEEMAAFSDFAKTKIYETYMKSVNAMTGVSSESNFKVQKRE
jgi:hypothetical protein